MCYFQCKHLGFDQEIHVLKGSLPNACSGLWIGTIIWMSRMRIHPYLKFSKLLLHEEDTKPPVKCFQLSQWKKNVLNILPLQLTWITAIFCTEYSEDR